jgi:hypothetical protein
MRTLLIGITKQIQMAPNLLNSDLNLKLTFYSNEKSTTLF